MPTAESTVEVEVPLSTAYNQWTQFESFPRFMSGVDSVAQVGDTSTHWVMSVAGVQREFDAEITDQVPDQHIAWQSVGEVHQGGSVSFEQVSPETTRVTLTLTWEPDGFTEKVGAAFQVDDALVSGDLQRFKSFIEERGTEEGGWSGEVHDTPPVAGGPAL